MPVLHKCSVISGAKARVRGVLAQWAFWCDIMVGLLKTSHYRISINCPLSLTALKASIVFSID